jgi:hypothetical protein
VTNGRKYARRLNTAANKNVEEKKQTQKAATLKRMGAPKQNKKKNQKTAHSSGSSALRRKRAIEVYQPKQKHHGKATTVKRKEDTCTQLRFVSAAQTESDRGVPTQTETLRKSNDGEKKGRHLHTAPVRQRCADRERSRCTNPNRNTTEKQRR